MAEVIRTPFSFDIARIAAEAALAVDIQGFEKGTYGHSVSLPSAAQIAEGYREHHNNVPFSGALAHCPYMQEIFDTFQAPVSSFRLLRRHPHAAYAFHDDVDRGPQNARFQIPFCPTGNAFLLIADDTLDVSRFDLDGSGFKGDANGDIWFDAASLRQSANGSLELYYLEPGFLYYFDTNQVHTLINANDEQRVTLSFDIVMTDWLRDWMQANMTERVAPAPIPDSTAIRWKWNNLRAGIIRS